MQKIAKSLNTLRKRYLKALQDRAQTMERRYPEDLTEMKPIPEADTKRPKPKPYRAHAPHPA